MKVKLEDILEALDFANDDTRYYYDVKNEKVLMVFDGMVDGEDDPKLIEEIEEGFIDDYIPLPSQFDIHEYRIMEEFIYDLPEGRNKDILARAIQGRGAFRRFKDRLYDLNLEQKRLLGSDPLAMVERAGGNSQSTIVFAGKWTAPLNPSCRLQKPIGASSFEWDYEKKSPTSATRRAGLYLNAVFGTNYTMVYDMETRKAAVKLAKMQITLKRNASSATAERLFHF